MYEDCLLCELIKGIEGNIGNEEEAVAIAGKIGYPVIIKAASGGGGRGMRIVRKQEEMEKTDLISLPVR